VINEKYNEMLHSSNLSVISPNWFW